MMGATKACIPINLMLAIRRQLCAEMVKPRDASGSALNPEAEPRTQHHHITMITLHVRLLLSRRILEGNPLWNEGHPTSSGNLEEGPVIVSRRPQPEP